MSILGFQISNSYSKDSILVKIYHTNYYRNISLGYIISSSTICLPKNDSIYVCIDYNMRKIISTGLSQTEIYYIDSSFKIDKKKIDFVNTLLEHDFGIYIRDYIGFINKKEIESYLASIQNTCK
jgi:hypothetical protein